MPTLSPSEIAKSLRPYLAQPDEALLAALSTYLDLLLKWNEKTNLTSIRNPQEIVRRHFGESLFVAQHVGRPANLLDYGSGAGFPGVPIAMLRPEVEVVLAESQHKKAAFLREVARTLELRAKVWGGRAEDMPFLRPFECVTLRAVDNMALSARSACHLSGGTVVMLTTRSSVAEILAACSFELASSIAVPGSEDGLLVRLMAPAS